MDKPDSVSKFADPSPHLPKGIVDPAGASRRMRLATYPPSAALAPSVDYFWVVEWDLAGRAPQTQRVMPYPNAHLVFEPGRSAIHGVVRGAFDRQLAGSGRVFGVRFRPGGLRPFIDTPLSSFTDATIPIERALGIGAPAAEHAVLSEPDDAAMVAVAEAMLLNALPRADEQALLAAQAVAAAAIEHGPLTAAGLAATVGIAERSLQRLFSNYVGVSPKWVIQRFRLQEAIARLSQHDALDLAALAQALGFFDQSHLTRDFTRLVGMSPLSYWTSQQAARPRQAKPQRQAGSAAAGN